MTTSPLLKPASSTTILPASVQVFQAQKGDKADESATDTAPLDQKVKVVEETGMPRDTATAAAEEQDKDPTAKRSRNPDIIHRNSSVLLKMPSGNYKLLELRKEKKTKNTKGNHRISLGKFGDFELEALIGKYYGIPLEIVDRGAYILLVDLLDLNCANHSSNHLSVFCRRISENPRF